MQEPPGTFNRSRPLDDSARWPRLLNDTALGWDFVLALAVIAAGWFVLARTPTGYRRRVTGPNPAAAAHAGPPPVATRAGAFATSAAPGRAAGGPPLRAR